MSLSQNTPPEDGGSAKPNPNEWLLSALKQLWKSERLLILIGLGIFLLSALVLLTILRPAYQDSGKRFYTSGFGYGSLQRKLGKAFPVDVCQAQEMKIFVPYLGEGVMSGNPIRVSVIPTALIEKVHVDVGDSVSKGQLLMELDNLEARRNVSSAKLSLETAKAELERVKIGSAYVLAQERPEHDQIELTAATKSAALLEKKLNSHRKLLKKGLIAETQVIEVERSYNAAQKRLAEATYNKGVSEKGSGYSLRIAENALSDAQQNFEYRQGELARYQVKAPADGLVSEVLVREGEFNQDFGKPAFVLTTGMWFEGYFDQSVLSSIAKGQKAEVHLEAFPGKTLHATVEKVIPEVTFSSGGPEISRPLRPRGTGSPEWAASFRVRFSLDQNDDRLALGMTGNVRLISERNSVVVPRNAVLSISAGRALIIKPQNNEATGSDDFTLCPVEIGHIGEDYIEILDGIETGEPLIRSGHHILEEGDKIRIKEVDWQPAGTKG